VAAHPPTALSSREMYLDPNRNPFDDNDVIKEMFYLNICEVWQSMHASLTIDVLYQNMLADFSRPAGAVGLFVLYDYSRTGCLKFVHGLQSFPVAPGHIHDRMVTMGFT
jgi:hypothetical protein